MSTTVSGRRSGSITVSITCTTPFCASTSTAVMLLIRPFGSLIEAPPSRWKVISSPKTVGAIIPSLKSVLITLPATTCILSTASKVSTGMSFNEANPSSLSKAANAALVGANTVKGPSPLKMPTKSVVRSLRVNAATRLENVLSPVAMSTTVSGIESLDCALPLVQATNMNKIPKVNLSKVCFIVFNFYCLNIKHQKIFFVYSFGLFIKHFYNTMSHNTHFLILNRIHFFIKKACSIYGTGFKSSYM